jgi:hypothetical protein
VAGALVLAAVIFWIASRPLVQIFLAFPFGRTVGLLLLFVGVTLLVAGYLQTRLGRADIRRGARILSLTITTGLLVTCLLYAGYARWLVSPTLEDTTDQRTLGVSPNGPWLAKCGAVTRGGGTYEIHFLLDPTSGRWVLKGLEWGASHRTAFSADGTLAVWMVTDELSEVPVYRVVAADLSGETPAVGEPGISIPGWVQTFTLSPDGTRLATVADGVLRVHEMKSGRQLVSHRLEEIRRWRRLLFAGPDRVRIHEIVEADDDRETILGISELDTATGRCEETGTIGGVTFQSLVQLSWIRATDRLIVRTPDADAEPFLLCDGRTGETIRTLAHDGLVIEETAPLADGRIVGSARTGDGAPLLVGFDPDGLVETTIDLAGERHVRLGGEVAPGRIALAVSATDTLLPPWRKPDQREPWRSLVVDLHTGETIRLEGAIHPLVLENVWWSNPLDDHLEPGSIGTRLFRDTVHRQRYLLLDPVTNELESLALIEKTRNPD